MNIKYCDKLNTLPPYLFVELDKQKRKAKADGKDVIDLGIGDPDKLTPRFIIDVMKKAIEEVSYNRYPLDAGLSEFRVAISNWYKKRFNVKLDPDTEILPLIGSKEGIAHLPFAFLNPGDCALVPDPSYPPYRNCTILAGGKPIVMPLLESNNFLPDLKAINQNDLKNTKIIFLNYPNNPTAAVANKTFFRDAVDFASMHNIIVCHDAAYSELYYSETHRPSSFLEIEGAKDVGIEFHSLSKTFNMTGWRIGFACGNSEIIKGLLKFKSNVDSGVFMAVQKAAAIALLKGEKESEKIRNLYKTRRDTLVGSLRKAGVSVKFPEATFYVWLRIPKSFKSSIDFAKKVLEAKAVVVTPGVGFGSYGEGFFRIALTVEKDRLIEAAKRIAELFNL